MWLCSVLWVEIQQIEDFHYLVRVSLTFEGQCSLKMTANHYFPSKMHFMRVAENQFGTKLFDWSPFSFAYVPYLRQSMLFSAFDSKICLTRLVWLDNE